MTTPFSRRDLFARMRNTAVGVAVMPIVAETLAAAEVIEDVVEVGDVFKAKNLGDTSYASCCVSTSVHYPRAFPRIKD